MPRNTRVCEVALALAILISFLIFCFRFCLVERSVRRLNRRFTISDIVIQRFEISKQFESVKWYIEDYEKRRPCYIDSSLITVTSDGLPISMFSYKVANMKRIPKIIHQTWPSVQLPSAAEDAIKSWRQHNPDWEYWLWTNESIRIFLWNSYPQYRSIFYNAPQLLTLDAVRPLILYRYGGVFADIDLKNLKPLETIITNRTCILSQEHKMHALLLWRRKRVLSHAFMASSPSHPFMKTFIKNLVRELTQTIPGVPTVRWSQLGESDFLEKALVDLRQKYKKKPESWYGWVHVLPSSDVLPRFDEDIITPERCEEFEYDEVGLCDVLTENRFKNVNNTASAFADWIWPNGWVASYHEPSRFGDSQKHICQIMRTFVLPGGPYANN